MLTNRNPNQMVKKTVRMYHFKKGPLRTSKIGAPYIVWSRLCSSAFTPPLDCSHIPKPTWGHRLITPSDNTARSCTRRRYMDTWWQPS